MYTLYILYIVYIKYIKLTVTWFRKYKCHQTYYKYKKNTSIYFHLFWFKHHETVSTYRNLFTASLKQGFQQPETKWFSLQIHHLWDQQLNPDPDGVFTHLRNQTEAEIRATEAGQLNTSVSIFKVSAPFDRWFPNEVLRWTWGGHKTNKVPLSPIVKNEHNLVTERPWNIYYLN